MWKLKDIRLSPSGEEATVEKINAKIEKMNADHADMGKLAEKLSDEMLGVTQ